MIVRDPFDHMHFAAVHERFPRFQVPWFKSHGVDDQFISLPAADGMARPAGLDIDWMLAHIEVNDPFDIHETVPERDSIIFLNDAIDVLIEGPVGKDVHCHAVKTGIVLALIACHGLGSPGCWLYGWTRPQPHGIAGLGHGACSEHILSSQQPLGPRPVSTDIGMPIGETGRTFGPRDVRGIVRIELLVPFHRNAVGEGHRRQVAGLFVAPVRRTHDGDFGSGAEHLLAPAGTPQDSRGTQLASPRHHGTRWFGYVEVDVGVRIHEFEPGHDT